MIIKRQRRPRPERKSSSVATLRVGRKAARSAEHERGFGLTSRCDGAPLATYPSRMRRAILGVASVIAVATAGCGGVSVAQNARVAGVVKLCGGPPPGQCFTERVRIYVLNASQRVVARSRSVDARFSFDLAPGAYTVSADASGYLIGRVSVHALARRTTRANITNTDVK